MKVPFIMKLILVCDTVLFISGMLIDNQVMMATAVIIAVIQSVGIEILEAIHKRG